MCIIKNQYINKCTKRFLDLLISILFLITFIPLFILIAILTKFDSKGPVLFWSERFGKNKTIFLMPKFRTMKLGTPIIDSDNFNKPELYLTRFGKFLRKTSFDEIPQLYSVFVGQMSLVGPRPGISNELELIKLRDKKMINSLKPGITGFAQINGRDEISKAKKVALDYEYLKEMNLCFDLKIIFITIFKFKWLKGISH